MSPLPMIICCSLQRSAAATGQKSGKSPKRAAAPRAVRSSICWKICSENEKVAAVLRVRDFEEEGACILLATLKGVVKKTELSAFSNPRKKGFLPSISMKAIDLIAARMTHPAMQIMLFTRNGMAVRFDESLVRPIGRVARGVRGVMLKNEKDIVVGCEVVRPEETILVVCENGFGKRSKVDDFRQTNRGGVGVRSIITSERNGMVVAAISVKNEDSVLLMSAFGTGCSHPNERCPRDGPLDAGRSSREHQGRRYRRRSAKNRSGLSKKYDVTTASRDCSSHLKGERGLASRL